MEKLGECGSADNINLRDLRYEARTEFRILFGTLIAVALGLAGLMSRGFGWL